MTAVYYDAYLERFCGAVMEERAYAEIDLRGTFATEWRDRLVVYMAYILVCLENQANEDDLFTTKLKNYQKEFDRVLAQARVATPDAEGNILPMIGVPLERA